MHRAHTGSSVLGVELPAIEILAVPDSESEPASPVLKPQHQLDMPERANPSSDITGKSRRPRKLLFDGVAVPLPPWKVNHGRRVKTTLKDDVLSSTGTLNGNADIVEALQSAFEANEKTVVETSPSATLTGASRANDISGRKSPELLAHKPPLFDAYLPAALTKVLDAGETSEGSSVIKSRGRNFAGKRARPTLRRLLRGSYAAPTRSSRQSQTTSATQSDAEFSEASALFPPARRPVPVLKPIAYTAAPGYIDAALETNIAPMSMPPPPRPLVHWRDREDDQMSVHSDSSASWPTARDEQLAQQSEQWCMRLPRKFARRLQGEKQPPKRPHLVTNQSRRSLFDEHLNAIWALGRRLPSEEAVTESDQEDQQPSSSSVQTDASELVQQNHVSDMLSEDGPYSLLADAQAEGSEANASSAHGF